MGVDRGHIQEPGGRVPPFRHMAVRNLRRQNPRKAAVTEQNREGKEMKESRGRYPMRQEGGEQDSLLESPGLQECSQTQLNP